MDSIWTPVNVEAPPQDGTWILVRGTNDIGRPMVPVVAAYAPPGAIGGGWRDSGSFKPCDQLLAREGTDWCHLPK